MDYRDGEGVRGRDRHPVPGDVGEGRHERRARRHALAAEMPHVASRPALARTQGRHRAKARRRVVPPRASAANDGRMRKKKFAPSPMPGGRRPPANADQRRIARPEAGSIATKSRFGARLRAIKRSPSPDGSKDPRRSSSRAFPSGSRVRSRRSKSKKQRRARGAKAYRYAVHASMVSTRGRGRAASDEDARFPRRDGSGFARWQYASERRGSPGASGPLPPRRVAVRGEVVLEALVDPLLVVGVGGALEHDREEVLELAIFHVVAKRAGGGPGAPGPSAGYPRRARALGRDAARSRRARRASGRARAAPREAGACQPARARLTHSRLAPVAARSRCAGRGPPPPERETEGAPLGVLHAWFGRRRGGEAARRLAREERGGRHDARGGEPRERTRGGARRPRGGPARGRAVDSEPSPDGGNRRPSHHAGCRRASNRGSQRSSQEGGRVRVRARPSASARRRRHPRRVATARRRARGRPRRPTARASSNV